MILLARKLKTPPCAAAEMPPESTTSLGIAGSAIRRQSPQPRALRTWDHHRRGDLRALQERSELFMGKALPIEVKRLGIAWH
jgi:hypothetical protein